TFCCPLERLTRQRLDGRTASFLFRCVVIVSPPGEPVRRSRTTAGCDRPVCPACLSQPLPGAPEPRPRHIDFKGHDGFDACPLSPGNMHRCPVGFLLRREPDGQKPALRLRAQKPVPLDAWESAE